MNENRFCAETGLGLVRVTGPDARSFLHAQTTQRIDDLMPGESRLAAWLNAKGRVRALFEIVADEEGFWLILPADNRDYLAAELGRFTLRADVKIEAMASNGPPAALAGIELEPSAASELEAVRHGRPQLTAALRERYIPQMLNLDRLGAVSFNKGCYPGQEIVARTQNLGSVKRRLERFRLGPGARPEPAAAVVAANGNAVGEINRVAAADDGFELLAVVGSGEEQLGLASDGRALERLPLPGAG